MDSVELVRTSLDAGDTPDEIAHALVWEYHLAPIPAIKAMHTEGDMTTAQAKEVVHRNLPVEQQKAAERLWGELIDHAERMTERER
jgi:hypothetical protein